MHTPKDRANTPIPALIYARGGGAVCGGAVPLCPFCLGSSLSCVFKAAGGAERGGAMPQHLQDGSGAAPPRGHFKGKRTCPQLDEPSLGPDLDPIPD